MTCMFISLWLSNHFSQTRLETGSAGGVYIPIYHFVLNGSWTGLGSCVNRLYTIQTCKGVYLITAKINMEKINMSGCNWTYCMKYIIHTFQRTGLRSSISCLMSSSQLWVLTTVLILNATWYFLHQSRTSASEPRWWSLGWYLPITLLVSSLKLSQEMAKMSRHSPVQV